MQARITVKYSVAYGEEKCQAEVTLYVPAINGLVVKELINTNIAGWDITPHWGTPDNGYRHNSVVITGNSWKEVIFRVNELVEAIRQDLKTAWQEGRKLIEETPPSQEIVLDLD